MLKIFENNVAPRISAIRRVKPFTDDDTVVHFRSNIQTAEFGLHQMYKHSALLRVYKSITCLFVF